MRCSIQVPVVIFPGCAKEARETSNFVPQNQKGKVNVLYSMFSSLLISDSQLHRSIMKGKNRKHLKFPVFIEYSVLKNRISKFHFIFDVPERF